MCKFHTSDSKNRLVPNEPQEQVKHETDKILTRKQVKNTYRKKNQSNFSKYNKKVKNNYYKLINQKD